MKERMYDLIKTQEAAIRGDEADAKRLGRLLGFLKFLAPQYVDMLANYRNRLMTAGYIAGMSDALGEQVSSEELKPWVDEVKENVKTLARPTNPWSDPMSYVGAYHGMNGPHWH